MEKTNIYYSQIRQRWHASIIDGLIISAISLLLYSFLPHVFFSDVICSLATIGYGVYFVTTRGQTPGKKYAGIKVITDGEGLTLPSITQAMLRETFSIGIAVFQILFRLQLMLGNEETDVVSSVTTLSLILSLFNSANIIFLFATSKHKALHDYIAHTVVIDSRKMEREERKREHKERILQILRND